jgi:hypothetical protein
MFRLRTARAWTCAAALLTMLTSCDRNLPTGASTPTFSTGTADILVSTTADDGPGSLRQAIADVPDGGTVGFEPTLAGRRIVLATSFIIEDKSLTIEAPETAGVTLDGDGLTSTLFWVRATGSLTLRNLTLTGSHGSSGAIFTQGATTIEHSTISGNHAVELGSSGDGFGGGIRVGSGAALTLVNSTVSGNIADRSGGGIAFSGNSSLATTITLIHSSVIGNQADEFGGAIYASGSNGLLTLQNSILSSNSAATNPNCTLGTGMDLTFVGTNLVGDAECKPRVEDIVAADPVVGPLAENGGPTKTHALLAGSPAIEGATQACAAIQVDQRYVARPQGTYCDIGAFEFEGFITPPLAIGAGGTISPTGVAIVSGTITCPAPATITIQATLRQSQKVGKVNTTVEATGTTPVVCAGTRPWSMALAPATGGFKSGNGTVTARTSSGPAYLRTAETSRVVKFVWGRK